MTESTIVWYCTQSDRECCAKVFVSSTEISSKVYSIHIITTVCHTAQHELFPIAIHHLPCGAYHFKKRWANLYGHKNPWQLTWQHEFMFRGTCQRGSLKSRQWSMAINAYGGYLMLFGSSLLEYLTLFTVKESKASPHRSAVYWVE